MDNKKSQQNNRRNFISGLIGALAGSLAVPTIISLGDEAKVALADPHKLSQRDYDDIVIKLWTKMNEALSMLRQEKTIDEATFRKVLESLHMNVFMPDILLAFMRRIPYQGPNTPWLYLDDGSPIPGFDNESFWNKIKGIKARDPRSREITKEHCRIAREHGIYINPSRKPATDASKPAAMWVADAKGLPFRKEGI